MSESAGCVAPMSMRRRAQDMPYTSCRGESELVGKGDRIGGRKGEWNLEALLPGVEDHVSAKAWPGCSKASKLLLDKALNLKCHKN